MQPEHAHACIAQQQDVTDGQDSQVEKLLLAQ